MIVAILFRFYMRLLFSFKVRNSVANLFLKMQLLTAKALVTVLALDSVAVLGSMTAKKAWLHLRQIEIEFISISYHKSFWHIFHDLRLCYICAPLARQTLSRSTSDGTKRANKPGYGEDSSKFKE